MHMMPGAKAQRRRAEPALQGRLKDAATIYWDLRLYPSATVTLGGNRAMGTPTNMRPGKTYIIIIKQDAVGTRTLSWPSVYKFPGGTDPVLSTAVNSVDVLSFVTDGTSMYGVATKGFA